MPLHDPKPDQATADREHYTPSELTEQTFANPAGNPSHRSVSERQRLPQLGLNGRGQQSTRIHTKGFRDPLDVPDAQVPTLALNARDVGAIQVTKICQGFLRQIFTFADLPHVVCKQSQQLVWV